MTSRQARGAPPGFTLACLGLAFAGFGAAPAAAAPSAIARCEHATSDLIDALGRGDYAAAASGFTPALGEALPAAKLDTLWSDTLARQGALRTAGRLHGGRVNGRSEVFVPLMFEKATVTADVICEADGRISTFRLTPPRTP